MPQVGIRSGIIPILGSGTTIGGYPFVAKATGNFFIGTTAPNCAAGAQQNLGYGEECLIGLTTGDFNTGVGFYALRTISTATYNTALGHNACRMSNAMDNTGIGARALAAVTTGASNTACGCVAGISLVGGACNVAVGSWALHDCVGHDFNVAVGFYALEDRVSQENTGVGAYALRLGTTGARNVALGAYAGYFETGSDKLFIDNRQRASEADGRIKALVYGVFAAVSADQRFRINGRLGITEVPVFANNAAAVAGGLAVGEVYRTNADPDPLCVVH